MWPKAKARGQMESSGYQARWLGPGNLPIESFLDKRRPGLRLDDSGKKKNPLTLEAPSKIP
ncbi:MAG: hypothetical protein BTN85_1544 [Candidatus Methanohalarchaeum thermophilum]|uniref:Uncharacterized protein n=1 Tax=Methanohalarchaeum thermophilum TaxID=1903181 RepID=A0A1Q6DXH3_METT1|nr:MAG: hypothetical protein BTN85_1544 [Candidatus Methanohalarchaeum thermophilum]